MTNEVLLVEDNRQLQGLEKEQFECLGFLVTAASDGCEALEIFQHDPHRFSLIFTDWEMPIMKGDELAYHIRQLNHHIPIILATGGAMVDKQIFFQLGFSSILCKPYNHQALASRVHNLISPKTI